MSVEQLDPVMRSRLFPIICIALAACLTGCNNTDQEHAREQASEAQRKTQEAAEKAAAKTRELGHEAKQEVKRLDERMNNAMKGRASTDDASASEKLDHAERVAKTQGREAAHKLSNAALITRVKAKLAGDLGASTLTNVGVDATGQVVTLTGTVSSESERRQAEQDAAQLDGVSRVINNLTVKP